MGCSFTDRQIYDVSLNYLITLSLHGCEEGNRYTVSVKSYNQAGISSDMSNNVTTMTLESGMSLQNTVSPPRPY